MDKQFKPLFEHIADGKDIIVPSPTNEELRENPIKYFDYEPNFNLKHYKKKLNVRHNLRTVIDSLPMDYLLIIQQKLDDLGKFASAVKRIAYPKTFVYRNGSKKIKRPYSC